VYLEQYMHLEQYIENLLYVDESDLDFWSLVFLQMTLQAIG